jgi:hypothetical protein
MDQQARRRDCQEVVERENNKGPARVILGQFQAAIQGVRNSQVLKKRYRHIRDEPAGYLDPGHDKKHQSAQNR